MNSGILNTEVLEAKGVGYISGFSHTSLKNLQADFSFPPCGTQGSFPLKNSILKINSMSWPESISLWRETGFSSAIIQREGSAGLGVTVLFQTQSTITNLKS